MENFEPPLAGDRTVFFCHVPKTAGTTLTSILQPHFDSRRIWPSHEAASLTSVSDLAAYQLVAGHYPLAMIRAVLGQDHPPIAITLLRDPVARYISNDAHIRRAPSRGNSAERKLTAFALEELLAHDFARRYRDRQVLFLAAELEGTPEEMCRAFERMVASGQRPTAAQAIAKLDGLAWVGICERMEESLDLLCFRMGWSPLRAIPRKNVAPASHAVGENLLGRIAQENAADIVLYEHALARHEASHRTMLDSLSQQAGRMIDASSRSDVVDALERHHRACLISRERRKTLVHFTFDRAVNSTGWHGVEFDGLAGYRWTDEAGDAKLDFVLEPSQDYRLALNLPFSVSGELDAGLAVSCNGIALSVEVVRAGNAGVAVARVPASAIGQADGYARFTFRTGNAIRVEGDNRALGVCMARLTLVPWQDASDPGNADE